MDACDKPFVFLLESITTTLPPELEARADLILEIQPCNGSYPSSHGKVIFAKYTDGPPLNPDHYYFDDNGFFVWK